MARTTTTHTERTEAAGFRTMIRWSAVFGGALLGVSLLLVLAALWIALAFGTETAAIQQNLEWYMMGSAIVALLVGGFLAGWMSSARGLVPGMLQGFTVWGLILILSMLTAIPGALQFLNVQAIATDVQQVFPGVDAVIGDAVWASFWTILGGFIAGGIGGALGGASPRPTADTIAGREVRTERHEDPERPRRVS
jgi:putative membrane protein (TIGR04086 family)